MKVLLIKDVYKVGRAGDVKKVADGYGRNFLIPQGLAVLATPGALKQAEHIRAQADVKRAIINQEMGGIAELLADQTLTFAAKAGETDKLYGSITAQMIVDAVNENLGVEINRRQLDHEPIRTLGTHKVAIRLTLDLIPEITVIVHREGEAPTAETAEAEAGEEAPAEVDADAGIEVDAEVDVDAESEVDAEVEVDAESEAQIEAAPDESEEPEAEPETAE